jgi:hypothetical protein
MSFRFPLSQDMLKGFFFLFILSFCSRIPPALCQTPDITTLTSLLTNCTLQIVSINDTNGNVVSLNISNASCRLSAPTTKVFLPPLLSQLYIYHSPLFPFQNIELQDPSKLRVLHIVNCTLKSLDFRFVTLLSNLTLLDLSHNAFPAEIDFAASLNQTAGTLSTIYLNTTQFTHKTLRTLLSSQFSRLVELHVYNNWIIEQGMVAYSMPAGILPILRLANLTLVNCSIQNLESLLPYPLLGNLRFLNVSRNGPLTFGAWNSIATKLTFFICRHCNLSRVTQDDFKGLGGVVYYDVSYSTSVPFFDFKPQLRFFGMRGCGMTGSIYLQDGSIFDVGENSLSAIQITNALFPPDVWLDISGMKIPCKVVIGTLSIIREIQASNTVNVQFTLNAWGLDRLILDNSTVLRQPTEDSWYGLRAQNVSLRRCKLTIVPMFHVNNFVQGTLILSQNNFTKLSLYDLTFLESPRAIYFDSNQLTSDVFAMLGSFTRARILDLSNNKFQSAVARFPSSPPPNLITLFVSSNVFSRGIAFSNPITSLVHLECTYCIFKEQSYEGLNKWTSLVTLNFRYSKVTPLSPSIALVLPPSLQVLHLDYTTGIVSLVQALSSTSLLFVRCRQCGLTGTVEANLTTLWPLAVDIDLSDNALAGPVPKTGPSSLVLLNVSNNNLVGWIYPSLLERRDVFIHNNPGVLCSGATYADKCTLLSFSFAKQPESRSPDVLCTFTSSHFVPDVSLNCFFWNPSNTSNFVIAKGTSSTPGILTCAIHQSMFGIMQRVRLVLATDNKTIISQEIPNAASFGVASLATLTLLTQNVSCTSAIQNYNISNFLNTNSPAHRQLLQ